MQITLPDTYGFVGLVAIGYTVLNQWQALLVGRYRKQAKIEYPRAYAEKAEMDSNPAAKTFNCAQRAHANTLEHLPTIMFLTLFGGLEHPTIAAIAGAGWAIGRVIYTLGYVKAPSGRGRGARICYVSLIALFGSSVWTAVDMIKEGLLES